ncbi:abequosyltransferase [Robbsia andropogonis]|nr:glycosyltransferase family 2 protein [Robbsia andropogonis]
MMKFLLTVAIPTYKRPDFLFSCLTSVYQSIRGEPVEVLVMDDSTDSTNDNVKKAFSKAVWISNKKNLGIDGNICACVKNASADYVWLIGEDDLMRNDSIYKALDVIRSNKGYSFIFANYSYITADHKRVLRSKSIDIESGPMLFQKFFENYLWSAGFIGGCIINRSKFLATDYNEFIGTYYAHVAGICLSSVGTEIYTISEPSVGNRVGDASTFTWSDDSFGVFQGWRVLLLRLKSVFGEKSFDRSYVSHTAAHGYLNVKFLMNKKADGGLGEIYRCSTKNPLVESVERIKISFVHYFIPRFFCRYARAVYARFRRRNLLPFSK